MLRPGGAAAAAALGARIAEDASLALPAAATECSVCLDAFDEPVATPCGHWFCKECILGALAANGHCPLCRGGVAPEALRAPAAAAVAAAAAAAAAAAGGSGPGGTSAAGVDGAGGAAGGGIGGGPVACESKLNALLRELRAMRRRDPTSKAVR